MQTEHIDEHFEVIVVEDLLLLGLDSGEDVQSADQVFYIFAQVTEAEFYSLFIKVS